MEYYDRALDWSTQLLGTVTLILHGPFWAGLKTVAFYTAFRALILSLDLST